MGERRDLSYHRDEDDTYWSLQCKGIVAYKVISEEFSTIGYLLNLPVEGAFFEILDSPWIREFGREQARIDDRSCELQMQKEMARYISEFPWDQYEIETVVRFERAVFFFVDSINDHIKNYLRKGEAWEKRISGLIVKYAVPGSVVIDVGAHIGTHTLTMAYSVGGEGRVVAFEPQPKIFRELFHNIRINLFQNVSCIWAAVGAENGRMEISPITEDNEGATPLVRTGISTGCWSSEVIGGTGMHVDVMSIDSLSLDRVSLIKIDVEGMENLVLEGARETIQKYKPVIILEIMGGWLSETAPPPILEQIEYTKGMITNLGYNVMRINAYDYLALPDGAQLCDFRGAPLKLQS